MTEQKRVHDRPDGLIYRDRRRSSLLMPVTGTSRVAMTASRQYVHR
ncbi:hypothetical protein [Kibdelosporangium philippinense]